MMRLAYGYCGRRLNLELQHRRDTAYDVVVDGREYAVEVRLLGDSALQIVVNGRASTVYLARLGTTYHVAVNGIVYQLTTAPEESGEPAARALVTPDIVAPMPGKVLKVLVDTGQEVAAGDGLLILEAMKMENRLAAEGAATVREVYVRPGQMVDAGEVLMKLAPLA